MSRKRKSDQPSSESTTTLEQPETDTGTVDGIPEAIPVDEAAAVDAVPMATPVAEEEKAGFAQKVGQKKWVAAPDPFGIARDNLAGVRLFESKQDRQVAIKFGEGRPEDKPSHAVIDRMKDAGYRWNPADRIWTHPVRPDSAMSTRIEAEWLYQEVRQMIRQEKGIEPAQDLPS